jgi:hypothetical protein
MGNTDIIDANFTRMVAELCSYRFGVSAGSLTGNICKCAQRETLENLCRRVVVEMFHLSSERVSIRDSKVSDCC